MSRKLLPIFGIVLWGMMALPLPNRASATIPLVKAVIQNLRNLVQLIPHNQPQRQARKADAMIPGDGLFTGRASLAELRFNDGSLARVGEETRFEFLAKTRNFRLSNGTVLLLIPPKRGKTLINMPNAAAAIRGSALFVQYIKETDTSVVGALTDSGIEVSNKDASETQVLKPGQMIVIVKGKFQGLYKFDLRTFYETSDLVRGLDLTKAHGVPNSDPAIASVQEETSAAAAAQSPITGSAIIENPPFLKAPSTTSATPINNSATRNLKVDLVGTGETISTSAKQTNTKNNIDNNREASVTQDNSNSGTHTGTSSNSPSNGSGSETSTKPTPASPPPTDSKPTPPTTASPPPPPTDSKPTPPTTASPPPPPVDTKPPDVKPPVDTKPPDVKPPVDTKPPDVKPPVDTKPPDVKPPVDTKPPDVKPPVDTKPPDVKPPVDTKPPDVKPPVDTKPPDVKPPTTTTTTTTTTLPVIQSPPPPPTPTT
jgi:FecR protein